MSVENIYKYDPLISVIIPVHNVRDYIEACLESIVSQDIEEVIEIILVDDCGSDDSIEIAEKFTASHSSPFRQFKFVYHPYNKGQGAARNEGVRVSQGKYLAFVDSDDALFPGCLKVFLQTIENSKYDIVEGQRSNIDQNGNVLYTTQCWIDHDMSVDEIWRLGALWYPTCWNKIIRRDFFIDNNLWFIEGIYYEDLIWGAQVTLANPKVKVIPHLTYRYNYRESSTTNHISEKHIKSSLKLLESLIEIYRKDVLKRDSTTCLNYIGYYERTRSVMIDIVIPHLSWSNRLSYFNRIRKLNLANFSYILKSKYLSKKVKIKLFPLYFGFLGLTLFTTKQAISNIYHKLQH